MLKDKIKELVLGHRASSEAYINFSRKQGIKVGTNVKLYRPFNTTIDFQNPHLLTIGNDVQITGPVTILTHDYSWSVLKKNMAIFMVIRERLKQEITYLLDGGATILGGSHVGNNVIIGANAVVSGIVEDNSVYAGNPAKKIMSLADFKAKREKRQLSEAKAYVREYKLRFGVIPPESKLTEYFFLFKKNDDVKTFHEMLTLMGNYENSVKELEVHKPAFNNYEEFIDYCLKD